MKWLILLFGVSSNALASVLIKVAITQPFAFPSFKEPMAAFTNWPFWLGLIFYGGAFLFYAAALVRFPLNIAHPILTCGTVATVTLLSSLIFKEQINLTMSIGIAFVLVGVLLITTQATQS